MGKLDRAPEGVVPATLEEWLEQLYGQERRRDKLGLEGTRALLGALGNPERRFRAIHVAGTNGKGSVCALIERALREHGVRTGLFTSPHLVHFRERIRVSGHWPDQDSLVDALTRIGNVPGAADRTFFEVATALGFLDFATRNVEWAVVEVGLGGRLDTTNVLEPELAIITPVGLDHTEILGATIEAIAAEKAGIVKPGVTVVIGAGMDPRAREVIVATARERRSPVVDADRVVPAARGGSSLAGPHQDDNARTARAALAVLAGLGVTIPAEEIDRAFASVRWPGRFEAAPDEPRLWWDGAHNPAGLTALVSAWRGRGFAPPTAIVLAVSRDKPIDAMLDALAPLTAGSQLIATRSRNERARDTGEIAAAARARGIATEVAFDLGEALRDALRKAGPDERVLLTGSLFAVGEAMEIFGGAPGEML